MKTKDGGIVDVEELSWQEARMILKKLNPELVAIVDELSPGKEYKLYRACYPFGKMVLDESEAYLPLTNGETISFNDPALPGTLRKNLSYDPATSNPVGIVLDKHSEFFLTIDQKVLPYALVTPGDLFGSARMLDRLDAQQANSPHISFFLWKLASGGKSLFMLPKISDNLHHQKLKKHFNLSLEKPNSYLDHWALFKGICHNSNITWKSGFLFFSNNWFEKLHDPAWLKLYCYFLRENRLSYGFWRNVLSWQVTFNNIEQQKNLRAAPYVLDTAKHLFAIAAGVHPGFKPATDDHIAPISFIQQAYREGYGLEAYPTIMQPTAFSLTKPDPVYYSLNHQTLIEDTRLFHPSKSIMVTLEDVQYVMEKYISGIKSNPIAGATSLYKIAHSVNFSYYHDDPPDRSTIQNAAILPQKDKRLAPSGDSFSRHSAFLKGCIQLVGHNNNDTTV